MPGTNPCHTPASYSSRSNRCSVPSSPNMQSSTPSAISEATATFVPSSRGVAPRGNGRPGSAASFGTRPTQAPFPRAIGGEHGPHLVSWRDRRGEFGMTTTEATVESARLLLQPWSREDALEALRLYGDRDLVRWLSPAMTTVPDLASMELVLEQWLQEHGRLTPPAGPRGIRHWGA